MTPTLGHHFRKTCSRCGSVISQCRCMEPKITVWVDGPCPTCEDKSDEEAATFKAGTQG